MLVGSLFSGIGGIDLGLERAGMRVAWQCEADPWCRGILARHWPSVPIVYDVHHIDLAYRAGAIGRIDLLAGGFPCQPVSDAGKRLAQADDRWLWPAFARCIRVLRPRYVLVENVPGLLARGMGDVLGDLAALGFDAEWTVFGARDVGAPHRRDRVWIVAYPGSGELQRRREPRELARAPRAGEGEGPERERLRDAAGDRGADVADANLPGRSERRRPEPVRAQLPTPERGREGVADAEGQRCQSRPGTREPLRPGPAQVEPEGRSSLPAGAGDGREDPWAVEPDVGRVAHGVSARVDRLRALGNAVVPQCAEHIGRWILEHDRAMTSAA